MKRHVQCHVVVYLGSGRGLERTGYISSKMAVAGLNNYYNKNKRNATKTEQHPKPGPSSEDSRTRASPAVVGNPGFRATLPAPAPPVITPTRAISTLYTAKAVGFLQFNTCLFLLTLLPHNTENATALTTPRLMCRPPAPVTEKTTPSRTRH